MSFEIERGVQAFKSCGVQFKGEFYIYGGRYGDKSQIAKVDDCALKRIGTLPFTHWYGACAATSTQLFLCFDWNANGRDCHVSNDPTEWFSTNLISESIELHYRTRIAANEGELVHKENL